MAAHSFAVNALFCFARGGSLRNEDPNILKEVNALLAHGIDPVAHFISRGATLDQRTRQLTGLMRDFSFETPLHLTCKYQNLVGLEAILDYVEQLEVPEQLRLLSARNADHQTPLDVALERFPIGAKEIKGLIKSKISSELLEPLEFYIPSNPVVQIVLEYYMTYYLMSQHEPDSAFSEFRRMLPVTNRDQGINWMKTLPLEVWKIRRKEEEELRAQQLQEVKVEEDLGMSSFASGSEACAMTIDSQPFSDNPPNSNFTDSNTQENLLVSEDAVNTFGNNNSQGTLENFRNDGFPPLLELGPPSFLATSTDTFKATPIARHVTFSFRSQTLTGPSGKRKEASYADSTLARETGPANQKMARVNR